MAQFNIPLNLALIITLSHFFFLLNCSLASPVRYNIVSFGAKPDGKTDSTKSFQAAWARACGSTKAATIYVPKGRFLLRNIEFLGPCRNAAIVLRLDGVLVAPSDYRVISKADDWVSFRHVDGVTVSGGVLDAQGTRLWACKTSGKRCPNGATTLDISNSRNVVISGVTSLNSQMFHIAINGCQNVKVQGTNIIASGQSPNTDGIHVQLSSFVTIMNTKIRTGDDCVSVGPGARNLWIEKVACGPGHGISIGSLGKDLKEPGVQNVTVKTVTFTGTQNGVRIKSWGRPSNGFARNILFQHCTMINVQNPIVIDQNYCPDKGCPRQISGVKVSDVMYQDIHGTSATQVAIKFDCSSRYPCKGIRLRDVKLTYMNKAAQASCAHAKGAASGIVQPRSCL